MRHHAETDPNMNSSSSVRAPKPVPPSAEASPCQAGPVMSQCTHGTEHPRHGRWNGLTEEQRCGQRPAGVVEGMIAHPERRHHRVQVALRPR